jgi:hypothetical protein
MVQLSVLAASWSPTPLARPLPKHNHALMPIFLKRSKVWMVEDAKEFYSWYTHPFLVEVSLGML